MKRRHELADSVNRNPQPLRDVMFKKVLIANRGEIAVRVIHACRELNVKTVAIFSDPDKQSRHVQMADEAWRLEGQPARVYLDIPQIVELAKKSGAEAVHPGYGFLSENGDFAQACQEAGLVFIGPSPDVIRRMGSKVEARRMMESAGVPVVPGTIEPVTDPEVVKQLGEKYGYPIAIKASAGGGGRGLRVVRRPEDVEQALAGAQREGSSYFGDSKVYVEKYLEKPHHVEVQIIGDSHGNVVHLFERDCSSQRRHQKLLEESPAPVLSSAVRERMLEAAVRGAKSLGYTSAGTIECLVAGEDFYFLEVNTRVQVEHPVTEFTTGIDIVKEQLRVAAGEPLSITQADIKQRGHAIECRINAEDVSKGFLPSPGTITSYNEPQMPWVRVDSACYNGYQVLPFYDSLLAKLVVWGRDRDEAIARTKLALKSFDIQGVQTTIPFHLMMLEEPAFLAGDVYTTYVEAEMKQRYMQTAAAVGTTTTGGAAPQAVRKDPRTFEVDVNQRMFTVSVSEVVTGEQKSAVATPVVSRPRPVGESTNNHSNEIRAAMHGLIKEVFVKEGDTVSAGQKLLIFEAMKMESDIVAARAGKVASLKVKAGETVEASALLVVLGE
jgi:acetyl-CoA/propionyl-CoA carboxylase biotin carboxyl carrier protein